VEASCKDVEVTVEAEEECECEITLVSIDSDYGYTIVNNELVFETWPITNGYSLQDVKPAEITVKIPDCCGKGGGAVNSCIVLANGQNHPAIYTTPTTFMPDGENMVLTLNPAGINPSVPGFPLANIRGITFLAAITAYDPANVQSSYKRLNIRWTFLAPGVSCCYLGGESWC
jgi:hypothetical protein